MPEVQHWTETQQEERRKKYPRSSVKPWVVMDGHIPSFFDTEVEAQKEASRINRDDKITESFLEWVRETESEYSVDYETIKEIVEAQI